jgi:putative Mg2+ transporter-C (MgtC) family protein
MSAQAILVRLTVATILGGVVGLERHRADKSAGMRTHMLVSLGSALIMIVSAYGFDDVISTGRITLDPSRVAAQVVSGVGFLGAGMILRGNAGVHGLTTAAGIWATAGLGLAAGGGLYLAAFAGTVLMLITLMAIKPLEDRLAVRHERHAIVLVVKKEMFSLKDVESIIKQADLSVKGIAIRRADKPGEQRIMIDLGRASKPEMVALLEQLQSQPQIVEITFRERRT